MTTQWTGNITLTAGQAAIAYAEAVPTDQDDVTIRMEIDEPPLVVTCVRSQRKFICYHDAPEQMLSVTERDMSTGDIDERWSVQVTFMALVSGTSAVQWDILTTNAGLENVSLTAE